MTDSSKQSLASLFSEESKANFARLTKPQEFKPKKRLVEENIIEEVPKKIKKPKHKHRKENLEEKINEESKNNNTTENNNNNDSTTENSIEKDQRTIFVGNVPITESINSIKHYFSEFGQVESVRIRSVPVAGTAVDEHGNQDLVRKVCVNKGKFGEQKGSFNAYVVFKNQSSAKAAFAANNRLMGTRHLRIDSLNPTLYNPKTSVFLGGLPFYTDEEELREHFSKVCFFVLEYFKISFNLIYLII